MAVIKKKAQKNTGSICVIGGGRFGQAVINTLNRLKRNVVLIDDNSETTQFLSNTVDSVFLADASDINALTAIGVQDFDTVIIAVSDNIEIVAALIEIGVKNIIARSKNPRHSRVLRHIGANVIIRPEEEAGEKAALIATNNNHIMYTELLTEVGGGFYIASVKIDNPKYIDSPLKKINFGKLGVSIVFIKRKNRSFLPDGKTKLKSGDTVSFIGEIDDITNCLNLVNTKIKEEILENEVKKKEFINS
ncbi:TrkA family potassium uptake protein [Mycoplasma iguanae]|uniref:TrkA family potassium uptake protein n=1 Tax=Mycoplasma iguanae TaxID=292461 RepID=A0ABY5R800_9MOLU|nr:TrkA family potassium uptake protein [Mycoplasma iguanae]UVD81584.1 TrkA family potassium uptake protein [Mycoplasma iguanae]